MIFIYIVLASQFGSFLQPLAIMASLPLALIGVMLALLVTRSTLNLFSMIGLVMLMGLVTKNAILLVDFANHGRKAGLSVPEALLQAGLVRMRPIIMTTAAMIFGMLPLALALDEGGELQAPMGRAIIGGVITSTLLTLVVVPVLYSATWCATRKGGAAPAASRSRAGGGATGFMRRRRSAPACRPRRSEPLARTRLLRDLDHVAHDRVDVVLPAPAAEDAVVADVRLDVVGAQVGPQPVQRSCAASVWPIAQMSSRSPSTVSSAVRRIAAGSILPAAQRQLAERQRVLLEHAAAPSRGRSRPTGRRRPCTRRRSRASTSAFASSPAARCAKYLRNAFDVALAVHADERAQLQEAGVDAPARAPHAARARGRSGSSRTSRSACSSPAC